MLTGNLFHQHATLPLLRQSLIADGRRRRHWTRSSLVLTWLGWATQLKLSAGVLPLTKRRKDRSYRSDSIHLTIVLYSSNLSKICSPIWPFRCPVPKCTEILVPSWMDNFGLRPRYISCGNQLKFSSPLSSSTSRPLFGKWASVPPHPPPPPNRRPSPLGEDLESSGNWS